MARSVKERLSDLEQKLGTRADDLAVIFVAFAPEAETPELFQGYTVRWPNGETETVWEGDAEQSQAAIEKLARDRQQVAFAVPVETQPSKTLE